VTDKDTPTPTTDTSELANQLDDLLREVSEQSASEGATPEVAAAATPDPLDQKVDAAIDAAPAEDALAGDFATPEQTLSGEDDALADQIQSMFEEAKDAQADAAPAADPAPAHADDPSIEQIDAALAAEADAELDAMAGGFESFDQVMGTAPPEAPEADTPEAHAPASEPVTAAQADADDALDADAFASPDDILGEVAATAEAQSDPTDPELEGAFASATDVADELDAQPEPSATAPADDEYADPADELEAAPVAVHAEAADEAPGDEPAQGHDDEAPSKPRIDWQAQVVINADRLRRVCAMVHRPMGKLSPEMRNTVGYIGIATLANASLLLVYKVLT